MFTGIVETTGVVKDIVGHGSNLQFSIAADFINELSIDQSISHNGVCLTVDGFDKNRTVYTVTAIEETLNKTNLDDLQIGDIVNLERCMPANGRFDGHIVQGHVDQAGFCEEVKKLDGSWELRFEYDTSLGNITVEKGSICLNGVSLTVFNSTDGEFSVAIIPYTWEHTNLRLLNVGDRVNLEFDIVGKYIQRILSKK